MTAHTNPTGRTASVALGALLTRHQTIAGLRARADRDDRPHPSMVRGWACATCGGGGVASDGSTCPDCDGHGHTL
jgi:hypothetical protein